MRPGAFFLALCLAAALAAEPGIVSVAPDAGTEKGGTTVKIEFSGIEEALKPPFNVKIGYNLCSFKDAAFDPSGKLISVTAVTVLHDPGLFDAEFFAERDGGGSFRLIKRNAYRYLTRDEEKIEFERSKMSMGKEKTFKPGTLEWYKAGQDTSPVFMDFWEDLTVSKPGDSWDDFDKYAEFSVFGIIGYLEFINIASGGGLVSEAKWKAFALTAGLALAKEAVFGSGNGKSPAHFCPKNLASGIAGGLFGSYLITIPFN